MLRHIWPNLWPVVVANSFLNFAFALVNLAALSFLGLGAAAGSPDWGRMLDDNRSLIFFNPWAALGPGLMIVLTAASMNILGDWLYERLSDRGRAR
jgi:peptide/nickel transport system permease protein